MKFNHIPYFITSDGHGVGVAHDVRAVRSPGLVGAIATKRADAQGCSKTSSCPQPGRCPDDGWGWWCHLNQWWINGESHDSDSRLWLSWLWSWLIWFTTESMTESMTSHAGILWIFCQWESMGSLCKPGHGKVRHSEGQSLATSSPRVLEQQTHCMKQQGYVSSVSRVISLVVFTNIYWHLTGRFEP